MSQNEILQVKSGAMCSVHPSKVSDILYEPILFCSDSSAGYEKMKNLLVYLVGLQ